MAKRARDAEMRKRRMARLRFKNLIHSVAWNRIWLMDTGDQKLSLNAKKNITLLVRPPRKIGLLTLMEKSLIRIHYSLRSVEERKRLVTLVGKLNCFSKISPKTRARLCKVIKFMVIGEKRMLIREGDPATLVYFVLTGEVEVSKQHYNNLSGRWVNQIMMIVGPGECIGDTELIERCARTQTYITTSIVELLVVFEDDFNEILRDEMTKQWMERKTALLALDYFKFLSKEQLIAACKVSSLKEFNPLETIHHEDKGLAGYTYFVVSGECMILQCLKILVSQRNGSKFFELVEKEKDDNYFTSSASVEVLRMTNEENIVQGRDDDIDGFILSDETKSILSEIHGSELNMVEAKCQHILNGKAPSLSIKKFAGSSSSSWTVEEDSYDIEYEDEGEMVGEEEEEGEKEMENEEKYNRRSRKSSRKSSQFWRRTTSYSEMFDEEENEEEYNNNFRDSVESRSTLRSTQAQSIIRKRTFTETSNIGRSLLKSRRRYKHKKPKLEENVNAIHENHFIDVGSLTSGGIFGLGEKLENRVIMARTTVQCLVIPRFWLLHKEQNPGNIWQRRRFYLDSTIPSCQSLFKDFVSTRHWQKFKSDIIKQSIDVNSLAYSTKMQDIPIIGHIVEANDE
uniref:Cyclic nucleotide-binding domain-containing protein n=1 Tax=Glossina brevipalpis TaxID=37001 RepID=A0A1A9WPS4_9MUSC